MTTSFVDDLIVLLLKGFVFLPYYGQSVHLSCRKVRKGIIHFL